jgi:hypothetical protein
MPPLPEPLWKAAAPEFQAVVLALVQFYEDRLSSLEDRLSVLAARLKLNSTNSSRPPSSDPIGMRWRPPTPPGEKRRGGHPGHRNRISGGTDSVDGSRFVERRLTVLATCRQQGRKVPDYQTTCFEADGRGQALPSLLPVATAESEAA